MAVRSPSLHRALRAFCLAGFALCSRDQDAGAEIPFAFEEHDAPGRPALYEYRPLVTAFLEARAHRLRTLDDAALAIEELRAEPAAGVFARAHADMEEGDDDALFRSVLMPTLTRTAEACGGFDWDDRAFDLAYAELEETLFSEKRVYAAVTPVVGLTVSQAQDVGPGIRVRIAAAGELSAHWPEAKNLLPRHFGREVDRRCLIELERPLAPSAAPPDTPGEIADSVTAIRLATAGPVAAGPVIFERLDWRPIGVRPVLPIAAAEPQGEPIRLDQYHARLAGDLARRLPLADEDADLGEALDRWELSLFQADPREQLERALEALLGGGEGPWAAAARGAVLLGETARERSELFARLRRGDGDAVRRALVETLAHGDRRELVRVLDDALLGVRPRPASYFARALAS